MHGVLTREPVGALVIGLLTCLLPRDLVLGRIAADDRWAGVSLAVKGLAIVFVPLAAISVAAGSFSPFLYFRF
jgi:hypothetical protein